MRLDRKELADLLDIKDQALADYISLEKRASARIHTKINFRLLFIFGVRPIHPWTGASLTTIHGAEYDPAWYFAWSSVDSLPQDDWMKTKALEWELGYRVLIASARYYWFEKQYIFPFEDADLVNWDEILKKLRINSSQSVVDQRDRISKQMIEAVPAAPVEKLDIFKAIARDDLFAAVKAIGWPSSDDEKSIAEREELARKIRAFGLKKKS